MTITVELLPRTFWQEADAMLRAGGGATNDGEVIKAIYILAKNQGLDVQWVRYDEHGEHIYDMEMMDSQFASDALALEMRSVDRAAEKRIIG